MHSAYSSSHAVRISCSIAQHMQDRLTVCISEEAPARRSMMLLHTAPLAVFAECTLSVRAQQNC